MDVVKILSAVSGSSVDYNTLDVQGTYSMSDQLGRSRAPAVVLSYLKSTVSQINFENFLSEDVYAIAGGRRKHPSFMP